MKKKISVGSLLLWTSALCVQGGDIFDNNSEGWPSQAAMPSARYSAGYAVWSNSLYVVGGVNSQASNSVFRYDGGTNWVTCATIPQARSIPGVFSLGSYLFCAGGSSSSGAAQDTVYRYDGTSWTTVNALPSARHSFGCAVLNGKAYVIGGSDSSAGMVDTVFCFDGTSWTTSAVLPATRYCGYAATLGNTLYYMGGLLSGGVQTSTILKFDGTNWTSAGDLPAWRYNPAVCVQSNRILVIGGKNSSYTSVTNIYAFDGTNWTEQLGLSSAVSDEGAGVISNQLYVVGGSPLSSETRYYRVASTGVIPTSCDSTGGVTVSIFGTGLGNGSDITNVTLCGIPATIQPGQTATSVVVMAGASGAPLYGDVRVYSASLGETVKSNYFTYTYAGPLFAVYTDSTNWTYSIPNNAAPTSTYKTAFGAVQVGRTYTNELAASEDSGSYSIIISNMQVTGSGAAVFTLGDIPTGLDSYGYSNFLVRFSPTSVGTYTASVVVTSDGYPSPFILNLSGTATDTAPNIVVLGTNGAVITSGNTTQVSDGTKFYSLTVGASWTNTFSITNNGSEILSISGYGISDSRFQISDIPSAVSVGGVSNFTVRFAPDDAGSFAGALTISNDSPTAAYIVNLAGSCYSASTNVGPFGGGNTITITNGYFGAITNVIVGGVSVTPSASGTSWFTIRLPAANTNGPVDLVVQTSDHGDTTLAGAYTYNPAGAIGGAGVIYVDHESSPVEGTYIYMGDWLGAGFVSLVQSGSDMLSMFDTMGIQALSKNSWTQTLFPQVVWTGTTVSNLPAGTVIDSSMNWLNIDAPNMGGFPQDVYGYVGFRFQFNSQSNWRYGWMRAMRKASGLGFAISGVAFTSVDGMTIEAGQTQSGGVEPESGSWTGGYEVVIHGTNLCNGSDITNVTLCGVSVTNIAGQSATQVVVWAGQALTPGLGDVRVYSVSFGETVKSNAFTYNAPGMQVLGTNGAVIVSDAAAQSANGTKFHPLISGASWTNTFSITNNGTEAVNISGYGISNSRFEISDMPASVAVGGVSNFTVIYSPTVIGSDTAILTITNDSPTAEYVVNLAGSCFSSSTNIGPYTGGNTVTFTNGNFGTITNVLVGGVTATIVDSGTSWFTITMPAATINGPVDLIVQTSDHGDTTLAGAYTYNAQGIIYDNVRIWEEVRGVPMGLYGHAVGVLSNNLYAIGGNAAITNVYQFDGTNWSEVAGLPNSREFMTAATLNDSLYAVGGRAGSTATNVYRFDGTAWTEVAGLPAARYSMSCGVMSGALYAAGGFGSAVQSNVYRFDGTNWSEVVGLPQARCEQAAAVLDGELYAAGGYGGDFSARTNMFRFNGTSWSETVGLPAIMYGAGMCEWDGALYHVGGWTTGGVLSSNVYRFDGTNWTQIAGLPTACYRLGVCTMGGHIYAIGGNNGSPQTNVYRYPSSNMGGVSPSSGSWTGGYEVVIAGTNMGNGSDITNVTLCGASATIESQSATQVVVTAGVAVSAGIGDVRVYSTSFGETVKSNAFTYNAPGLQVLGTNGVVIASGADAQTANGTKFSPLISGASWTNTFSITNNGTEAVNISGFGNSNPRFEITGIPASVAAGGVSNFTVKFAPTSVGTYNDVLTISNDSPTEAYVVRLYGPCYAASTNVGPFGGGNTITIMNGYFGDITNVLVGGVAATLVESSGSIFTIMIPAATNAGTVDIVVQTSDEGDILLKNAYTYNPAGEIGWVDTHVTWTNLGSGVNNWVEALAHDGTTLYAGGLFTDAGGVAANYIARWNGTNWSSLGAGMGGTSPRVADLEHDGTNLYAGGSFTTAGGMSAYRVARWDGSSWSALGSGLGAPGYSELAWEVLLADGNLYAAGRFTNAGVIAVTNIAMWNGSSWAPLGAGLGLAATIDDSYDVYALAHDGTNLYAGGEFTTSGGLTVNRVAMWNGTSWTNLGSGMDDYVRALVHDGTNLYAAGGFQTAGGVTAHRIAMWNGTSWTNLGDGMDYAVEALAHDGTNLYAGGNFSTAGGVTAERIAKWNGTSWSAVGGGISGQLVRSLLFKGTDLYAGGWFSAAGGVPATNIAQWKTTITTNEGVNPAFGSWTGGYEVVISGSNLGNGSDITNVTLCGVAASISSQSATQVIVSAGVAATPGLGDVVVYSTSFGETVKNGIFTYEGPDIQVSGSAFSPTVFGAIVTNMFTVTNSGTEVLLITAVTNSGSGSALFNGSAIPSSVAPGTASNFPVVFTASTIGSFAPTVYVANDSPVPSYAFGVSGSVFNLSTNVGPLAGGNTITVTNGNFGSITNVRVGASPVTPSALGANWFTITLPASVGAGTVDIIVQTSDHGDITLPNAYTYNPSGQIGWTTGMTIWTNMGSGLNDSALALLTDGADVYVGGMFTTAGGASANRIAKWNGTTWTNLGSGLDNSVYGLAGNGTNLYVVGNFGSAGGVSASAIAMWNGETWTNLGGGLVGGSGAAAVLIAGSTVYASGWFTNAGGVATKYVAAWDGTSWTNLGTGLSGGARSLAHDGTNLYVGGQFTDAGGVSVMNVAKWDGTNWSSLGSGIGDRWANVYKLIYTGTTLYACGMFDAGSGKARVARWNGSSWTDVSGGVGGDAYAMTHDGTNLYVGGNFTSPGNRVAKWNGTAWSALGSGLDNPAWALAHNGTTLYAGGGFSSAGGVSVSRIAMWTPMVATNYGVAPMSGSWTGGYEVVISGMNLCNGSLSDVTGVTLCGVAATVTGISGSTQIVVTVGAATVVGTGHVVVVSTDYGTTIKSNIFAYSRAAQMALTFSPTSPQAYGTTNGLTVSGGSGTGAVSFAVTSGPGLIVGSTNLTITAGTGDVVVVATKAQDDLYLASSATATVTAAKATQTITLDNPGSQVTTNHVGLQVTASSGLQVTCTVVSGSATITGYTNMTFSGAGSVVLAASQAGDSNWYAAMTVTQSFTVVKTAQSALTFTPTSPQTYNTTNALTTSGGFGTGAVSYAVIAGGGHIVGLTNLVVTTGTGSVIVVATKATDAMYLATAATGTVTCAKAPSSVFLMDLAQVYNGTARTISATTLPAGLTVEFTYDSQATAPTNAGSYAVTGTVNEINYQGLTTGTLVVARALDTITFGATNQMYDGVGKAVTAAAGSTSTVSVTYNGETNLPVNVGSYAVTGVVDAANWMATNTTTLTIIKGDQVITNFLPADGVQFVLNSSTSLSAQASSGLPVSFSNLTPEIALLVGASIHFTNPGVARVQAYQLGNTNWNAATPVTHEWRVGGLITNVTPTAVNVGGGIEVVVQGVRIGNGTDITNVMLAGVRATVVTQTENDVTVLAGVAPAAITGDVEVTSGTGGYMVLSNAFEYLWLDAPVQLDPVDVTVSNLLARWLTATGATTHLLDVGLDTNFTSYLPGYEKVDVALAQQYPVTGLTNGTWYAIRLFGWNTNGYSWPSRTVWVPTGTNTPYETHPLSSGPVSQGAVMECVLSNMFYGVGLVYTAESSDTNVMEVAVVDGQLVMTPRNLGTATITVHATNPMTGYTASYSFTVQVVGEPTLTSTNFLPREAWNPRFTQALQVRNDSGVDAIGVRVLFTNLMPGITVENQTGVSADGRPMIEMETAFTHGATLSLNIVYLCMGAYRVDLNPPTLELQYILPEWTAPLSGGGTVVGSGYALPDGRILIQFDSVVGHMYAIEYCANFPTGDWVAIPLRVRATANQTQWIDSGPPATRPFEVGEIRTYRIKEVTE